MAITSEIIGKLGGAEVEAIPVEVSASGGSGSAEVLATIEVPEGETWLIAVIGEMNPNSTAPSYAPELELGADLVRYYSTYNLLSVAGVHTGVVEARIRRRSSGGSDSFTGHVYTVKM